MDSKSIKEVYSHISDKKSRLIYENRVLYSLTNDERFIDNIVKSTETYQWINNILPTQVGAYIYGAGTYGKIIKRLFSDNYLAFIDQHNNIDEYEGLSVIPLSEADNSKRVYISTKFYHREVLQNLIEAGFLEQNIINVGQYLENMSKKQYFDLPELVHDEGEVFVDVGAYDGDSTQAFMEWSGNHYNSIYCFEPDSTNLERLLFRFPSPDKLKVSVIQKGAWSSNGELYFSGEGEEAKIMQNVQGTAVPVVKLDDAIGDERVTYIKMDIEGAEFEALCGAKGLIVRDKPKLAICVYHKSEDIFKIPKLILDYNPDYRLYFGHYTLRWADTVMYAI